jgi:cell division protein FtsW
MGRYPIAAENISSLRRADTGFIIAVILLCGMGFTTLYSTSPDAALRMGQESLYFVTRQLIFLGVGFACMIVFAFSNLELLRKYLRFIVIVTLILCLLTRIPVIGVEKNGAYRWINMGPLGTFQPSELAKFTLVIFLANLFAKKYERFDDPRVSIIPAVIMMGLFFCVVYQQNDLSTSFFIFMLGLVMFFIAGVRIRWFVGFFALGFPLAVLFVFAKDYRVERLIAYLNPGANPQSGGYQAMASKQALLSGGFWGRGLGGGVRKIASVPEVQADFIFAGWGEEMGFIGVVLYLLLLAFFAWRGYRIAAECSDRFLSMAAFGSVSAIVLQSLMNCGVVSALLPATGIPLPFFSAGGSSLLITLLFCGVIINVSKWNAIQERRI